MVGDRALAAVLLVHEEHGSQRAPRWPRHRGSDAHRIEDHGHAGSVVDGTGPEVPRVEVGADHHDLLGLLGAEDLGDHVGGRRERRIGEAASQDEPDRHRTSPEQPVEQFGVLHRESRRWNGLLARREEGCPGVGNAQGGRGKRAHQRRSRTLARRRCGAPQPEPGELSVSGGVLHVVLEEDDPALHLRSQRGQFLQAPDLDHLGGDPARRRRRAHPQRGDGQWLGASTLRCNHLGPLLATDPVGDHHRLHPDRDSLRPEPVDGPAHGRFSPGRPGQARADAVGELGQDPAGFAPEGLGENAGRLARSGRLGWRGRLGSKGDERQQRRDGDHFRTTSDTLSMPRPTRRTRPCRRPSAWTARRKAARPRRPGKRDAWTGCR